MTGQGDMTAVVDHRLEPGGALALEIVAGQHLRVYQVAGGQVADLISFNADALDERLSMWMSCCRNDVWKLTTSHVLVSHDGNPMWTVVEDTLRENYSGGGYCSPELNRMWHGQPDIPACESNFIRELKPWGIGKRDFSGDTCFNLFMCVDYRPEGHRWTIVGTPAQAHDEIVLRAEMNQVVAVSNCPCTNTVVNHHSLKPLGVAVLA